MRLRDGQPCFLSDSFYNEHPHALYPEIESKCNRPHVMYLVKMGDGMWFAIPLRSNIRHRFCFKTTENGGLDYSKAIPLLDESFVDTKRRAFVRQSEWPVLQSNKLRIKRGMESFVRRYKKAKKNPSRPGNHNLLRYSTLRYFEKELGL